MTATIVWALGTCSCSTHAMMTLQCASTHLQLCHCLDCLFHRVHVDAPVAQMLLELGVCDKIVLVWGIAVDVGASWCDCAKLHHQGVLAACLFEVLQRRACTCTCAVKCAAKQAYRCLRSARAQGALIARVAIPGCQRLCMAIMCTAWDYGTGAARQKQACRTEKM